MDTEHERQQVFRLGHAEKKARRDMAGEAVCR
jgi:hypothetical protein